MSSQTSQTIIATPARLTLQRFRHQALPAITFVICASIAAWLWARQNRTVLATGEVSAVRVEIHSKYDGMLQALPQPLRVFDTVRAGQIVARVDSAQDEAELQRLERELAAMQSSSATQPAAGATVAWYQARIDELRTRIDNRDAKSSIAGMIVKIECYPGESARVGKPIMTIAADRGEFIIGYLRQDRSLQAVVGMEVELRTRARPSATFRSQVLSVGAQVEIMPARHWRNPQVAEWGLPVQIAIPPDSILKPGELVDLVLYPSNGSS